MDKQDFRALLQRVAKGETSVDDMIERMGQGADAALRLREGRRCRSV